MFQRMESVICLRQGQWDFFSYLHVHILVHMPGALIQVGRGQLLLEHIKPCLETAEKF